MSSAPTDPLGAPPYLLRPLISGITAGNISCVQGLGSEIYVGCDNGELLRYALQAESDPSQLESYTLQSRQSLSSGKPIDDLVLIPYLSRVLILCDRQVHFYTLPSLDPVSNIKPIRNVETLAVDSQHLLRPIPSAHDPPAKLQPVDFCVIKRNTIALFSLSEERLAYSREIPFQPGAQLARRTGHYLCVADGQYYNIIDLQSAQMFPIIPLNQAMDDPTPVKPFITVISENEFLLLSWTGASTLGVFITGEGDPVRGTLEWPSHPLSLCLDYPHIATLLQNGTVEVHNIETQSIVQVVSTFTNDDLNAAQSMGLVASVGGYMVPSERSEKLRKTTLRLDMRRARMNTNKTCPQRCMNARQYDINDNDVDDSLSRLSVFDESDTPQTPPRSPSRLDFCTSSTDDKDSFTDLDNADVTRLEDPPPRLGWTFGFFGGISSHKKFTEDDSDENDIPTLCMDAESSSGEYSEDDFNSCHTPAPAYIEEAYCDPHTTQCTPTPVRPMEVKPHVDLQETAHLSRLSAQRLDYPHHGLSRSALLHQKTFWNARQEEWKAWQARRERKAAHAKTFSPSHDAYGGMDGETRVMCASPSHIRTPPSGLERDLQDRVSRGYVQDLDAPIYPRVGDISALRDPYSVNVDRYFFKFPLWTIHKTLYVFNMHQRSTFSKLTPSESERDGIPGSPSASSLRSDDSMSSGDEDSDITLVAEDLETGKNDIAQEDSQLTSSLTHSPYLWNGIRAWELSWYARWELLIGLVQRDQATRFTSAISHHASACAPDANSAAPPKAQLLSPLKVTFRFVGEDGEDDSGDEEEDYGMLVQNPIYSKDFEDGYHRAVQFFHGRNGIVAAEHRQL